MIKTYTFVNLGVTLYTGDVVLLSDYPSVAWIFRYGYLGVSGEVEPSYYFQRVQDGYRLPLCDANVSNIKIVKRNACVHVPGEGGQPIPEPSLPFTEKDKFNADHAAIVVDTYADMLALDTSDMPDGKEVKVNEGPGAQYYAWDALTQSWVDSPVESFQLRWEGLPDSEGDF